MHRFITHYKKLNDLDPTLKDFVKPLKHLGHKLQCYLFQHPKNFQFNEQSFKKLKKIKSIIRTKKCVFEFRNKSWFNEEVNDLFVKNGWVFSASYYPKLGFDELDHGFNPVLNSQFISNKSYIYIRLHGSVGIYVGAHDNRILTKIAKLSKNRNYERIYVLFNNTDSINKPSFLPDAIRDALRLKRKI